MRWGTIPGGEGVAVTRRLYSMPLCSACQARAAALKASGVAFDERPLADLERGDISAAELDRMGLLAVWTARMLRGEPHLVAPVEIEIDAAGVCRLVYESEMDRAPKEKEPCQAPS